MPEKPGSHSLLSMETKRTILQLQSMRPGSALGSSKSEASPSCPRQLLGQHRQMPELEGPPEPTPPSRLCCAGLRSLHLWAT